MTTMLLLFSIYTAVFFSPAKCLCLACESFGQSEFQVKKSLKCFHFSFAYASYCRVNAGSNYVYPIFADSESPPPLQKLVYAFVAVDLWLSQKNIGVNNLHSFIIEIHVETFVTGYKKCKRFDI